MSEDGITLMSLRLRKYLDDNDIPQKEVVQATGLPQPYISEVMSGKKEISKNAISIIKNRYPSLNLNWLFTGHGSMYATDGASGVAEPRIRYLRQPAMQERVLQLEASVQLLLREVQALRDELLQR